MRRPLVLCLAVLAAGLAAPGPAPAQSGTQATSQGTPSPGVTSDTAHWIIPRGAMGSVGIAFPSGPERDPPGREGAGWLLLQSFRIELARRLQLPLDLVSAQREGGASRLVAAVPSDRVEEARSVVHQVIFEDPVPRSSLEEARGRVLDQLQFQSDSPYLRYQLELRRFLFGTASPWAHAPGGSIDAVSALDPSEVEGLRTLLFPNAEARWAVVHASPARPLGLPRDEWGEPARTPLGTPAGAPGQTSPADSASEPGAWSPRWSEPDRLRIDREITNTWIAGAFPLEPGLTPLELDFLLQALGEALSPIPADPGLFDTRVHLVQSPSGPLVVLEAAVFPEEARRWEALLLDRVEEMAADPPRGAFFQFLKRRYRTRLALDLANPVDSANLLLDWSSMDPAWRFRSGDITALSREQLMDAARKLGRPWVLVYGPDLGEEESGAGPNP